MSEKKKIGFALLSKEKMRELCSQGGKKAHELGRAHKFDSEQGKAAGHKGGIASGIARREKKQKASEVIPAVPQEDPTCPPTTSNAS